MSAILLASAGVIILLVGGGAGFWIGRSGVGGSKARVEKAETELEEYKRGVTEHFGQTAAHFQAIGKQYRELYEHMASGEQALCEPGDVGKQLLFAPGADTTPTDVEEPVAETVAEEEAHPPIDYAESPIATEAEEAPESGEEITDEQVAEAAGETETAAEPQPESKAEGKEQTIH